MYNGTRFRKDIKSAWKKVMRRIKNFFGAEWRNGFNPFKCFLPCFVMMATLGMFLLVKLPFFSLRLLLKR